MATFQTNITIDSADVATLKTQGYSLYAFKAVKASGDGSPTVWFKLDKNKLLTNTKIEWQENFSAYNSTSQIAPNTVIETSNTTTTDLGHTVKIDQNGNLLDTTNGIDGAVGFLNNAQQQFTVGISQEVAGVSNVLCAFPILGTGASRVITPITKILLIFSTEEVKTETVITKALSSGAFIDLTGVQSRDVVYSVTNGWSPKDKGAPWIANVSAFQELKPLLIEH